MKSVVVTGWGVVSPLASTEPDHTARLLAGDVAVEPSYYDAAGGSGPAFSAHVTSFDASEWMSPKVVEGTDIFARWAVAAATQAVRTAGLDDLDPLRTGVITGTSMGGTRALMEAQHRYESGGPGAIPRKTQIKVWPNMAGAQISMQWKLHGPQLTVCTACASGVDALGTAARMVESGLVDVVIAGGSEGGNIDPEAPPEFTPASFYATTAYGMTPPAVTDRLLVSRPFDRDREGIVVGEGSAFVVLENEEHAVARGATILARVVGYGSVADSYHPSAPEPEGTWEELAMQVALDDAGIKPERVGAVVAHATGTPKGDIAEIRAINRLFGHRDTPVLATSLKGSLGHCGAASGVLNLIAGIHAMNDGQLAATMGTTTPDPEIEFDVVMNGARDVDVDVVQVNAFGFGGQNASLVATRPQVTA